MLKLFQFDEGKPRMISLRTMFLPSHVFIVGGSPYLKKQNYKLLESRGVFSIGLNNVSRLVRTSCCMTFDNPKCYYRSVLLDSGMTKLARLQHSNDEVLDGTRWNSIPNTLFFNHKNGPLSEGSLGSDELVCPNSVLASAVAFALATGTKKIILSGCDFEAGGYCYSDDKLKGDKLEWNDLLYNEQIDWLVGLKPMLDRMGVSIIDTSYRSKLGGVYQQCSIDFAVKNIVSGNDRVDEGHKPGHVFDYIDKVAVKVPERMEVARARRRRIGSGVPVVSALDVRDDGFDGNTYVLICLCFLHSLSESNPGRKVYLFLSGEREKHLRMIKRAAKGLDLKIVRLSEEKKKMIPVQGQRGFSTNLRCALPKLLVNEDRCIWMDCDLIVNDNLDWLEEEADRAWELNGRKHFFQGCIDLGYCSTDQSLVYTNAGVEFIRMKELRDTGMDDELLHLCEIWSRNGAYDNKASDQNTINAMGADYISPTWNVTELTVHNNYAQDRVLWEDYGRVFHYIGYKWLIPKRKNKMVDRLSDRMKKVKKDLGDGIFDFDGGGFWQEFCNRQE
jgi:lipopolysaccharide biosynthesis glycosyltransferase